MASGDAQSPLTGSKLSASSNSSQNECDEIQWMLLPNNLEINSRPKHSKKQRNKEKLKHFPQDNIASNVTEQLSSSPVSFQNFSRVKSNTASWLKDQLANDKKIRKSTSDSEEAFSDTDLNVPHGAMNFPITHTVDVPARTHPEDVQRPPSRSIVEKENSKSNKDDCKSSKVNSAIVFERLTQLQDFISEATSLCQELEMSDIQMRENCAYATNGDFPAGSKASNCTTNISFKESNGPRSLNSDDSEIGQRVAAVEFERKKLKNKLVELQEKKRMNDELLRELSYLKDVTVPPDADKIDGCTNFSLSSSRSSRCVQSKDKKRKVLTLKDADRRLMKLQTTMNQLEEMMEVLSPRLHFPEESGTNEVAETFGSKKDSRNTHSVAVNKHDNVRKEINGFPARRHYEAEGRANEDVDVPQTAIPNQSSIPTKLTPEMQAKLRQLHRAQRHIRVIDSVMTSIQEAQKAGRPLSNEHLNFLSTFQKERNNEPENDASSIDSDESDYQSRVIENNHCENFSTEIKEICLDADKGPLQQVELTLSESKKHVKLMKDVLSSLQECEKSGRAIPMEHLQVLMDLQKDKNKVSDCESESEKDYDVEAHGNNPTESIMSEAAGHASADIFPHGAYNMESESVRKKDFLAFMTDYNRHTSMSGVGRNKKPTSQIKELPPFQSQSHSFTQSSVDGRNIDVRSSGEGGHLIKRNSKSSRNSLDYVHPVQPLHYHQDNFLLTRQNIATMESQNQGCSRNLHRRTQNTKKDNINNLSGKIDKLSIQNSVNEPFTHTNGPKDNLDSISTLSSELNQSRSGETDRKTIFDILKHKRKKQVYNRNEENCIHSNSSIDSEPLECSNSALAVDATVAATWGGSSTQENFDYENEGPSEVTQRRHHLDGASVSNYLSTSKSRKITKMGPKKETMSSESAGLSNSVPCASDAVKDYQQQISMHFVQQLKRQIHQLNALCQEELLCERPLAPQNCHQNCNPSLPNTCQSSHVSDFIHPYNQQLMLCLSHSYHTLYMQQMEIQHLHHYIRHHIDSEVIHQTNAVNPHGCNGEDFEFHPWCMSATSNPPMPSNIYSNDEVSSRSATYIPMPVKSFPSHSSSVSSNQPVRAVIRPANQGNRTAQERLNNQVPPRTRANNFWDNFRSYSRQNLLSTSNTAKRNENTGLPITPQVRQVHPMVSNENSNNGTEVGNQMAQCYTVPSDISRSTLTPDRQLPNSRAHDIVNSSKKPNISAPSNAQYRYSRIHKKDPVVNVNSSSERNLYTTPYESVESSHPNTSSVNLIQLQPNQDLSKIGNFSPICPTSAPDPVPSHSTSDPSNIPQSEFEYQSDFLIGLYREAKTLKSDVQRQQALKMIQDLAKSEKTSENESSSHNKIRNDYAISSNKSGNIPSSSTVAVTNDSPSIDTSTHIIEDVDSEKSISRVSETNLPWINQNLPTAAISPLSKQLAPRSVSTGAVRKKPKHQSTCFWDSVSNTQTCTFNPQDNEDVWDDYNTGALQPIRENNSNFPKNVVENIIIDLQSALPFAQMKEDSSDSFWSSINAYIISRIRAHMNVPLPHKSLASLRQALDHLTSEMKFCYNEGEFLKCISQLLHDGLTCFISTGRFTSCPPSTTLPDESMVMESSEKTLDLSFKIPVETDDKTQELSISMPVDDVFLPQFRTVLPQNILSTVEAGDNSKIQPLCAASSEEEASCKLGPEAETETEVEACTEADLAEADQSPNQNGNITNSSVSVADSWSLHVDQSTSIFRNGPTSNNPSQVMNLTVGGDPVDNPEILMGAHCCPDSYTDHEIILDDVPTKLSSTEGEPQKLEEQSSHLSTNDVINVEKSESFPESNNNRSEVNSTKDSL